MSLDKCKTRDKCMSGYKQCWVLYVGCVQIGGNLKNEGRGLFCGKCLKVAHQMALVDEFGKGTKTMWDLLEGGRFVEEGWSCLGGWCGADAGNCGGMAGADDVSGAEVAGNSVSVQCADVGGVAEGDG